MLACVFIPDNLVPNILAAQAPRKETARTSASSGTQAETSGKQLFQQHCASCHYAEATAQKIGPGLKGLSARGTFADHKKVTDGSLAKWIEDGGKNMPGLKDSLNAEQIRAVISYIKTL
jgi:cytochrome c